MAAPIRFPFHDSLAHRIANLITSDIEALEKAAFKMPQPTGWQSIFKRPYKAHYANMISKRAHQNSEALDYIMKHLREYEAKAQAYTNNTNKRGRPLTQFVHDANAPDTLPDQKYNRSGKYAQGAQDEADETASDAVPETSADDQALIEAMARAMAETIEQAMREGGTDAQTIEQFKREASAMTPDEMQRFMEQAKAKTRKTGEETETKGPDGKPIKRFGSDTPKVTQAKAKRDTPDTLREAMEGNAEANVHPASEKRIRDIAREEIEVAAPQILDAAKDETTRQINTRVPALVAAALKALVPNRVEVTLPDGTKKDLGVQHEQFPLLLKTVTRFPVWLPGPAGSGKTTGARNCAIALDIPFHHHGAVDNVYQLLGFIDAGGHYHGTSFRAAYEHGGVFLWDEVDASNPAALVAFNAAIENGECVFPDATIARHPKCLFIAAANTYGTGATHEYVGRTKLDAATLDRFVMLDWGYDEKLERAIAGDTPWTKYVQTVRRRCKEVGVKHLVTPRASIRGNDLLAQGIAPALVVDMTIRKGLADDQWNKIMQTVGQYRHDARAAA